MKVVVIGHGTAGQTAAAVVKKVNLEAEVTVLEKHKYVAFHPCSLPAVLGGKLKLEDVIERAPKGKVKVITEAEAELIDLDRKEVRYRRDGGSDVIEYDKLILATGLRPTFPKVNMDLEGVGTVWDVESVERLLKVLGNKVVVIGGSATGIEVAAELSGTGREVVLIEMMEQLMPGGVDPPIASTVAKALKDMGVKVMLKTALQGFKERGGRLSAVVTNRGEIEAETAIVVTGAKPNVELARRSGLPIGEAGGVKVDDFLYVTEDVLAAGDVAEVKDFITGKPTTTGLASTALVQGRIAGENVIGKLVKYKGALSPYIVKLGELAFGGVGISASKANRLGMNYLTFRFSGFDLPRYIPEKGRVLVWMITTPEGRIIGAQVFGRRIRQYINFLTAAIYAGFRVQDVRLMEFAYQPEITDVLDPVAVASEGLSRKYRLISR